MFLFNSSDYWNDEEKMKELKEKCLEMDRFLKKENVKTWEGVFEKFAIEMDKDIKIDEIKREIRKAMSGGMGSFNDLALSEYKADKKLRKLRKELFELGRV